MISGDIKITEVDDGVIVECLDIFSRKSKAFLPTSTEKIKEYLKGEVYVHILFPSFTAEQREFLVSGFMAGEYDRIMGPEE